jgi:hypothetical protein
MLVMLIEGSSGSLDIVGVSIDVLVCLLMWEGCGFTTA